MAGPTPYRGPTCCRPTHPGGMHGTSRGPVAPGIPAPTNTRPGGTHGRGAVPREPAADASRRVCSGHHTSLRDAGTNGGPEPGATGPRLISNGPPGPRRCPSRPMRRVAANKAAWRGQRLTGDRRVAGRRIPEGCMVLAGGRWPPEYQPPQIRVPEGRMDGARCHASWRPTRPGGCAAAIIRPSGTRAQMVARNRGPPAPG